MIPNRTLLFTLDNILKVYIPTTLVLEFDKILFAQFMEKQFNIRYNYLIYNFITQHYYSILIFCV